MSPKHADDYHRLALISGSADEDVTEVETGEQRLTLALRPC